MAYDISLDRFPGELASTRPTARPRGSLFRRWLDAVMAARQRRADREIARRFLLSATGRLS